MGQPELYEGQEILPFKVGYHINNGPTFNEVEVGDLGEVRAEKIGENEDGRPQYSVPKADLVRALIIAADSIIQNYVESCDDNCREDFSEDYDYLRSLAVYLYERIPA